MQKKDKDTMSMIDDVKKSIQSDLSGIKAAADLMTEQQPDNKENIKDTKSSAELDINIDQILSEAPEDDKGNKIIPDEVFDRYYKQLPNGTRNESRTKLAVNGGILKPLGSDPERDKDIQRQGADALNAKHAQRRTLSDTLDTLLRKKATPEDIATYNLPADATYQDAIMAAMMQQAAEGNVKAGQFIRDTIGEQPTAKQDLNVSMTDDDKRLLEKVEQRLNG